MLSLGINGQIIVPDGDARIDNDSFNADFLEAFWKLPQHSSDEFTITLASIYRRMTLRARVALVALGDIDTEFRDLLRQCHERYAAFAHPDTGDWPEPAEHELVDREYLTGLELVMVFRDIQGRRMVEMKDTDDQRYLTFDEFRLFYQTSVLDYITQRLQIIAKMGQAALELCKPGDPTEYHIRYVTADAMTGKMVIKAYSMTSLERYLARMRYTLLELSSRELVKPQ